LPTIKNSEQSQLGDKLSPSTRAKKAARQGGKIAGDARKELEKKTNKRVVSATNYLPEKKQKKIE
jgi:hypothetical protein